MGLYDTLRCEMPLPVEWPVRDFQTKSLCCQMERYTIEADGSFIKRGHDFGYEDGGYRIADALVPIDGQIDFYSVIPAHGFLTVRATFFAGLCRALITDSWKPFPGRMQKPPAVFRPPHLDSCETSS